jgi:hypothetical protein
VGDFTEEAAQLDLDAMSNAAYRVFLVRPEDESPLFRALTIALLVLLGLTAVGALIDLLRKRPAPAVTTRAVHVDARRALRSDSSGKRTAQRAEVDRAARSGPPAERWH